MSEAKERAKEQGDLQALLGKYMPRTKANPSGTDTWGDAGKLLRAARGLSRIAERQCSEEMSDESRALVEAREKGLEKSITALAAVYGAKVTFDGDPRGYVVKLHFEPKKGVPYDGRKPANTWGGEESGYGI